MLSFLIPNRTVWPALHKSTPETLPELQRGTELLEGDDIRRSFMAVAFPGPGQVDRAYLPQ